MQKRNNGLINRMAGLGLAAVAGFFLVSANAQELTIPVQQDRPEYVAGEVLVKFHPSVSAQAQNQAIDILGAKRLATVGKAVIAHLKLPAGMSVPQAVESLKSDPSVAHAQPNYLYYATAMPNDTNYGQLWGLKNTGQTISNPSYGTNNPGTSGLDMDAELAWDQITNCSSTVVAVLDTGINYTHQDLAANMWTGNTNHGWDFIDSDNDPMPTGGLEDHGTHVAGTIAAVGNNSNGATGLCWQAQIMSVRVLGATGSGSTAGIIQGIEWASNNGAGVINMSLGYAGSEDDLLGNAITYAQAADVVVVVAAGNSTNNNDGSTFFWPCNFTQPNLLCVAALDQAYSLASFSNWGATSVDVGAPGTNVLSSWAGTLFEEDFNSGAGWFLNGNWTRLDTISSCVTSGGTPIETLVNPANWCAPGTYATGVLNDTAYKSFDLSGATTAAVYYFAMHDTEAGADFFRTNYNSAGGNPFTGGVNVNALSGSSGGFAYYEHDLSSCLTTNCSLGFQLESDGDTTVDRGVSIALFNLGTLEPNTNADNVINGTSMASPHVAGLATLLRAYNPNYTYQDVVAAIKSGGEDAAALSGITTTGKAANAMGSLAHINTPDGLAFTLL